MKKFIFIFLIALCSVSFASADFSFAVFGDMQASQCYTNNYTIRQINAMAQSSAEFFIQTGDLLAGYTNGSCFNHNGTCTAPGENGNVRERLAPLISKTPPAGLNTAYFQVIGNHDDGWGSWYPDPCGDGICDLLNPALYFGGNTPANICTKTNRYGNYSSRFYYSFAYQDSYFIILRQNQDYSGMLSCNNLPSAYSSCSAWCSNESLLNNSARNSNCYNIGQYDWLISELRYARTHNYKHIFVFAHAPLVTSSWNHAATAGADYIRALLEREGVDIFFNGHNHNYERTYPIKGNAIDANGTIYLTVAPAGAPRDGINGAWFTAASYGDWNGGNSDILMSGYSLITVRSNGTIDGARYGITNNLQDSFSYTRDSSSCTPICSSNSNCDDSTACTNDVCNSPGTCASSCSHNPISSCISGDGCCPSGCTAGTDSDCACNSDKIYVANYGSDTTGTGASCTPYATLARAVQDVGPGDTIHMQPGTYYPTSETLIETPGTAGSPIILEGPGAIMDGSSIPSVSMRSILHLSRYDYTDHNMYWTIDGISFMNSPQIGLRLSNVDHVNVRNSEAGYNHDIGMFTDFSNYLHFFNINAHHTELQHGLYISNSGDNHIIENSSFHHNFHAGAHNNGDATMGGDGIISNVTYRNNVFYENIGGSSALSLDGVINSRIYNNLFYNNRGDGIGTFVVDGAQAGNNIITHNTIYFRPTDSRYGFIIKGGSVNNTITNNIVITGLNPIIELDSASTNQARIDYNAYYKASAEWFSYEDIDTYDFAGWRQQFPSFDSHSFVLSNPSDVFVNISNFDFRQKSTSPTINTGTNQGIFSDMDGKIRPQGTTFDIGCFEYYPQGNYHAADTNANNYIELNELINYVSQFKLGSVTRANALIAVSNFFRGRYQ